MRYIQTLYIDKTQDPLKDSFGWYAPKYHLMSWALSCLTLQKTLGSLELYVNKAAEDLLINKLNLPYNAVHTSLADWELPHPQLWALPKIHTYGIQTSPFIHIDGDIYIFNKFPQRIETGEIVAQNMEKFTDYYYSAILPLKDTFQYIPKFVKADFELLSELKALNAGILGGNNTDFFKLYSEESFKYVYSNLHSLDNIDINKFNIFFEQHLCYKMAEYYNGKIEYLLGEVYDDNSYKDLADFYKIPVKKANYFHLLGQFKSDEFICKQLAATLKHLYPQYYYRIIGLFTTEVYNGDGEEKDKNDHKCFLTGNRNYNINSIENAPHLDLLNELESHINYIKNNTKSDFSKNKDFASFCTSVQDTISYFSNNYSDSYINGRDVDSYYWYKNLYGANDQLDQLSNVVMGKAPMLRVISSKYDWARLYCKSKTNGVHYYNTFSYSCLTRGKYYALLVNEVGCNNVSIYDINEFEECILSELSTPLSVDNLVSRLSTYADEDVLINHMEEYKTMTFKCIKELILKKAIMPFYSD